MAERADKGDWIMSTAAVVPVQGVRFEDLPDQAWPRQEIIDGSLHVTPNADGLHQTLAMQICAALLAKVPLHLQVLPGANVLRRSETDRFLVPDVLVVDKAKALQGPVWFAPEDVFLVAEIISPSSRAMDLHLKRQLYAEWGIGTYWVFDLKNRAIHEFGTRDRSSGWLKDVVLEGIWPS